MGSPHGILGKGKPRAKAKKADETRKSDLPDVADVAAVLLADLACAKCGSVDAEHPELGTMLLCEAQEGGRVCNRGFHLRCLSPPLSRVPRGRWYCDFHTTKGAGCVLGCECEKHKADGKRARAHVNYRH